MIEIKFKNPIRLSNFDKIFDTKSIIRDAKISNILGVSDVVVETYIIVSSTSNEKTLINDYFSTSISEACLVIDCLKFKIDNNLNIIKTEAKFFVLKNKQGKLVSEMMKYSNIQISPKIDPEKNVIGFYLEFKLTTT